MFGERGLWGYKEDGDGGMEDDEDDVYDDAEEVSEGGLRRDQKAGMRCFFVSKLRSALGKLGDFDEAVEDEEDEKAIEKRDGEPGRPIRITLAFEVVDSGPASCWFRVGGEISFSDARVNRAGFGLRFVRPPEAWIVWTGCGFCGMTGALGRVWHSGAE